MPRSLLTGGANVTAIVHYGHGLLADRCVHAAAVSLYCTVRLLLFCVQLFVCTALSDEATKLKLDAAHMHTTLLELLAYSYVLITVY